MDEPGQLVAGEERLLERRVARQRQVARRGRGPPRSRPPGSPPRAGSARRPAGARRAWGGSRSRSRGGAPATRQSSSSSPKRARVAGDRRLDRERMAQQRLALRVARSASPRPVRESSSIGPARIPGVDGRAAARRQLDTVPCPDTTVADAAHAVLRHRGRRSRSPARVRAAGNKNAALPILAACLLTDEPVTLAQRAAHPRRRDDARAASPTLGADVEWTGAQRGARARRRTSPRPMLDAELCRRIRASFLLAGPLLARCGRVTRAAAGRRRDRPPPARHAHPRLRRARRRGRRRAPATSSRARQAASARASSSTRRA